MNNFLNTWLNTERFSDKELELMNTERVSNKEIICGKEYDELKKKFFGFIPYSGLDKNVDLTFDECETNIINKLFNTYVTDETLVITSNREHPSIDDNLKKCKNVIRLDYEKEVFGCNFNRLNEVSKYKNILVIVVGTHVATGQITPQIFFTRLKQYLISKNVKFKMVLDDAQGIFIVPRDYRMFDYVLGTAHASVERYNMGICISNNSEPLGEYVYNWGYDYLDKIDVIMKRKYKLSLFRNMMTNYYYDKIVGNPNFTLYNTTPVLTTNLFSIIDKNRLFGNENIHNMLIDNHMELDGIRDGDVIFVRFRGQYFLGDDRLLESINAVNSILEIIE